MIHSHGIHVCIKFFELFNFNKIYGIKKKSTLVLIKHRLCILKYIKDVTQKQSLQSFRYASCIFLAKRSRLFQNNEFVIQN